MPKPLEWIPIKTSERDKQTPSPRLGHTLVQISKGMYVLFGGLDKERKKGKIIPNDEVYTLRISRKGAAWTKNECEGEEIPMPRTNHAACDIGDLRMFVFGGLYCSKYRFNDVHILQCSTSSKSSFFKFIF